LQQIRSRDVELGATDCLIAGFVLQPNLLGDASQLSNRSDGFFVAAAAPAGLFEAN
jgi:hypothetical protein